MKLGYPRLTMERQAELLSLMLGCLDGKPANQQDSVLQLLIPVLGHVTMPSSVAEQKRLYGMADKPASQQLLLDFALHYLLLPYRWVFH